jgi:O-antigen/teichoic acid export membrane protein
LNRPLVRGLLLTLAGTASVALVSLLRNVLIARVMGPAIFGLWHLCLVAMRLASESHLGALSSVAVESPRLRGAGRDDEARDLERRATAVTTVVGLVAGLAAAAVLRLVGGPPLAKAAALLAVTILLQQRFFALTTVLRARRRFGDLAVAQLAFAVAYLVGLLLLLRDYFLTGALLAGCLGLVLAIAATRRTLPGALAWPRPSLLRGLRPLLVEGLPVYLVHLTFAVMLQTDRMIVGAVLGPEALGLYGVLVLGGTAVLFVPDAFSGVLWPFAGERFGRKDMRPAALRAMSRAAVARLALLLTGLLPAALGAIDVLVGQVLVQYEAALPALRVYGASIVPLALALPVRNMAMTVGAGPALLRLQLVVGGAMVALQVAAAALGGGLIGVAAAGAAAWTGLLVGGLGLLVTRRALTRRDAVALLLVVAGLTTAALLVDAGIGSLAPAPTTTVGALLRIGVPLLLTLAVAPVALRRLGARGTGDDERSW